MAYNGWQATVQDDAGNAIPLAEITVREGGPSGDIATIYSDTTGTAKANPFFATVNGFAQFFAEPGTYYLVGALGGQTTDGWYVTITADVNAPVVLRGPWDASAGTFPGSGTAAVGDMWIVSVGGTVNAVSFSVGNRITALVDNASTTTYVANWFKETYSIDVTSVQGRTGAVVLVKADVGLGSADNTADADKPVSTLQAAAMDAAIDAEVAARESVVANDGGSDEWAILTTGLRRVMAEFGPDGDVLTKFMQILADSDGGATLGGSDHREGLIVGPDSISLGPLSVVEHPEGFAITAGQRVMMSLDSNGLSFGDMVFVLPDGSVSVSGMTPVAPYIAQTLLVGDELCLVSDRPLVMQAQGLFTARTDDSGLFPLVTAYSTPTGGAQPLLVTARDGAISIPPASTGSTINITARDPGRADRYYRSVTRRLKTVPVSGSPAPKIMVIGDSISNRQCAYYLNAYLTSWGYVPSFIGTMTGYGASSETDGPLGEAREGWATGDFLNTQSDGDFTSILASGGEAAYLALPKEDQRLVNPFITGTTTVGAGGTFNFGNYLSRFSLASPDVVVLNIGMNDVLELSTAAAAAITSNMGTIVASIRSALPSAVILLWITSSARDLSTGDTIVAGALGAAVRAVHDLGMTLRDGGDANVHLVPTWAAMSQEVGWGLTTVSTDADSRVARASISEVIHPVTPNRQAMFEMIAAAVACNI